MDLFDRSLQMKKQTRSILRELENILPQQDKINILESRAGHIITSAIHLLEQIQLNFEGEQAEELEKRFFSALRNRDPRRFERGIKKCREDEIND